MKPMQHQLAVVLVGDSFDNIVEPCEELLSTPNLSLQADMELETINLNDDLNVSRITSTNANLSQLEKA